VKVGPLLGMTIAVAVIVAPTVAQRPPLLVIWNASPSVPVGLYLVTQASPHIGDLAVLRLPPVIAAFRSLVFNAISRLAFRRPSHETAAAASS